jgi:hypothetical protein
MPWRTERVGGVLMPCSTADLVIALSPHNLPSPGVDRTICPLGKAAAYKELALQLSTASTKTGIGEVGFSMVDLGLSMVDLGLSMADLGLSMVDSRFPMVYLTVCEVGLARMNFCNVKEVWAISIFKLTSSKMCLRSSNND